MSDSIDSNLQRLVRHLRITLSATELSQCAEYAREVSLWNKKLDLTGAKSDEALIPILFADAWIVARKFALTESARIVDIGSGCGAPAIPLALLCPSASFVLVEPLAKRVAFMRTAVGKLKLQDRVEIVESRFGAFAKDVGANTFTLAMSRATFAVPEWIEKGSTLAPKIVVYATPNTEPDVAKNSHVLHRESYTLPEGQSRTTLLIERV